MDVLHTCCAGLDVHKRTIVACVRRVDPAGKVFKNLKTFATMTGVGWHWWLAHQCSPSRSFPPQESSRRIGYARVSTLEQNLDLQRDALSTRCSLSLTQIMQISLIYD
jgi:hypothetical protein